jgi:hypothetical protein
VRVWRCARCPATSARPACRRGLKDASTDPARLFGHGADTPSQLRRGHCQPRGARRGRRRGPRQPLPFGETAWRPAKTWRVSTGSVGATYATAPKVVIRNSEGARGRAERTLTAATSWSPVTATIPALLRVVQDWHPNYHDMAPCPAWLLPWPSRKCNGRAPLRIPRARCR